MSLFFAYIEKESTSKHAVYTQPGMSKNTVSIEILVDENGKGASAIRGVNSSLDSLGSSGASNFSKAKQSSDAFQESLNRLNRALNDTGKPNFFEKYKSAFDDLEKRADKTFSVLRKATEENIAAGKTFGYSQIVTDDEKAVGRLITRLRELKRESAQTENAKYFQKYREEIRLVEADLDKLVLKNKSLGAAGSNAAGLFSKNPRQAGYQKQQLLYQANDVATMAAMGANPTQIIASQAGQIAQIFEPKQIAAFAAAHAGLVTTVVAGAAAIALTYKITGDIREEAERRLKAEENIQIAINKQIIAQRESLQNLKDLREEAERNRNFQGRLQTDSVESLKSRRATLEKLVSLVPAGYSEQQRKEIQEINARFGQTKDPEKRRELTEQLNKITPSQLAEREKKEILELDARIAAIQKQKAQDPIDTFRRQGELDEKAREDALKAEEKRIEKFKQSVEQANAKVTELKKNSTELLRDLTASASDNPFVKIFSDADRAAERLRETMKGLSKDSIEAFARIQQQAALRQIFGARLDASLGALDLRQQARNFRSYADPKTLIDSRRNPFNDDQLLAIARRDPNRYREFTNENGFVDEKAKQDFKLRFMLSSLIGNNTGASAGNLSTVVGGIDLSKIKRNFTDSVDLSKFSRKIIEPSDTSSGFNLKSPNFPDLGQINLGDKSAGALATIAARSLQNQELVDPNKLTIDRLREQLGTIDKLRAANKDLSKDDLAGITDKRIISLTSSLRPEDLTGDLRERAAQAREREAVRLEKQEQEAAKQRTENNDLLKQVNKNLEDLKRIAQEKGLSGLELILKNDTGENFSLDKLTQSPSHNDVDSAYNFGGFPMTGGSNR